MFGKKNRALTEQLNVLQEQLTREREAHQAELELHRTERLELESLRSRIDFEERVLKELQDACRQKLKELDQQAVQFEWKKNQLLQELQEDILQQRTDAEKQLQEKIQQFGSNYNFYLSQLGKFMDTLTEAAAHTGALFLTQEEADPTALFQQQMNQALQGVPAMQDVPDAMLLMPERPEPEAEKTDETAEPETEETAAGEDEEPPPEKPPEEPPPEMPEGAEPPESGPVERSEAETADESPLPRKTSEEPAAGKTEKQDVFAYSGRTRLFVGKSRILFGLTAFMVLLCSLGFIRLEQQTESPRYHQHIEQPSAADLGICYACVGQPSRLCTHLPIIRVETGGQKIPGKAIMGELGYITGHETGTNGEEEIPVTFSTIETEGVWHHAQDTPDIEGHAMFRIRGNSSRAFSKPSYRLKLVDGENPLLDVNLPLLGMNAESEWALHGPFLDKTLLRNYMWMNISGEIMGYAPDVRFCELILDGQYQGVYVLMETITQGEGRVRLTEYEPGDIVCSYIVRLGSHLNDLKKFENFTFYTNRIETDSLGIRKEMEILYPTTINQTQEVKDYVTSDFNEIERLLYSSHMNDDTEKWREYVDMHSFVHYYILQEFLAVNDAFSESTYFYRDVRGKIHIGPVWDYNNVLNNFFLDVPVDEFILSRRGWFAQLMMDEDFVNQVVSRYRELREGPLSTRRLNRYVDETINWLGDAIGRNYAVWGYSFDISQLSEGEYRHSSEDGAPDAAANPANYEEAVTWMRNYMQMHGEWLDAHIDSLKQHCTESKNATRIID